MCDSPVWVGGAGKEDTSKISEANSPSLPFHSLYHVKCSKRITSASPSHVSLKKPAPLK